MARQTVEQWLPEEYEGNVIKRISRSSVAENFFKKVPMGSDTKKIARSASMAVGIVAKGTAYPEDVTTGDNVILDATKFGVVKRYAEEDIDDSFVDIVANDKEDWAGSYGRLIDNATLAVTAAANGTTVPFDSLYKKLSTTNAATGYAANANIIKTATTVAATYENLSAVLAIAEGGGFYDEAKTMIFAHPSFKATLRTIKDGSNRYVFTASPREGDPDTLFGLPIKWSDGLRTSAVASSAPAGNALLVVANTDFLLLGIRTAVESVFIDGKDGVSSLTDESILKMRVRRAFAVAHEKAAAILEIVP